MKTTETQAPLSETIREVASILAAGILRLNTRTRVTQIMNLLNLTPDIQEEILFLPRTTHGRDPIPERHIRPIASVLDWRKQRNLWRKLKNG